MKTINTYINEKLKLTTKHIYTCQPQNKGELQQIIMQRIENEGPECDLNDIDTSQIIDMGYLFGAGVNKIFKDFNGDISMWNVSNVRAMFGMFYGCKKFNCDLSKWNVSNVEDMDRMFYGCENFDCDLSTWDVLNVKYMKYMFCGCKKFNCDMSRWDVSNVKHMHNAFKDCPTTPKWYDRKKWE